MDVICEHCEAEYEFDETLLSDKGTTVKCSACAHVFRVMPPQRAGGRPPLMLRGANGGPAHELASLRELQQRIRDGQARLDDEIGREGTPFRKLRDVPELKNFFASAAASEAAPAGALDKKAGLDRTLLGNSPTARPPEPYHDPAFPAPRLDIPKAPAVPRFAPVAHEAAPGSDAEDKASLRTMAGMGPLSPPRPPLPAHAGSGEPPAANEAPVARAAHPAPSPVPSATEMPTLLGTPAAQLPRLEPAIASPAARPGTPASGTPIGHAPFPSALSERPVAAPLPRFELPGKAPESKSPPSVGRAWASAPPPSGPPAPASWAAKSAAPALPSPAPMRLYVADDDAPPARAMRRTSRIWLVGLLAIVGVGGWVGVHALSTYGGDDVAVAPMTTPPPAATPAQPAPTPPPEAEPPKQAPEPAQPEAKPVAAKPTSPTEAKPAPADKPAPASKPSAEAKPAKPAAPSEPAKPKPEDYGQLVAKATQLSNKGDQAGAIKAYQAALVLRPTGSDANSGLGFALLKANQPNDALPLLDRAAESGFVEANIGLGDAYRKLGQPSAAVEAYRAYLERQPDGSRAAYARSWLDKLEKGGDRARDERPRNESPAAGSAPADEGYRPAGELLPPSEPAPEAPPPPAPSEEAPATEPAGETN